MDRNHSNYIGIYDLMRTYITALARLQDMVAHSPYDRQQSALWAVGYTGPEVYRRGNELVLRTDQPFVPTPRGVINQSGPRGAVGRAHIPNRRSKGGRSSFVESGRHYRVQTSGRC